MQQGIRDSADATPGAGMPGVRGIPGFLASSSGEREAGAAQVGPTDLQKGLWDPPEFLPVSWVSKENQGSRQQGKSALSSARCRR